MEASSRKIVVLVVTLALLAGAVFCARPVYKMLRTWRAERLAAEARDAIERQDWSEASRKAQAAYHLDPTSPEAIRVVARLYTIAGHPNAFAFWENLNRTGDATAEDRRELVRAGLRAGRGAAVREEAMRLATAGSADRENLRLAAEYFLLTGEKTNALRFSRELMRLEATPDSELVLAKALLASGGAAEQALARGSLQRLAEQTNAAGLEANVVLGQGRMIPDLGLPEVIERLTKHPQRQLPHRLLAEELRLQLRPQDRAKSVAAFVGEVAGAALTNRMEVARWLNRQKEFERSVELILGSEARTNREAFLVRIDALAALGAWKAAREELEVQEAPIEPVLRELYLARTARELRLLPEAEAHWRRVHLEVASQPEALLYVAEYAERMGEPEEARKAYERLSALPEYSERAFAGLIRLAEQIGGTRTLREIMRDLSARRPDDTAPQNDYAYLNLLLNERLDVSKDIARKLYDAQPNVMAFRTTLALAHLRLSETNEARRLYQGLNLNWMELKPGWQAVHAAVVASAGETNFARTLTRQIPVERLKPEEKELIQGLM